MSVRVQVVGSFGSKEGDLKSFSVMDDHPELVCGCLSQDQRAPAPGVVKPDTDQGKSFRDSRRGWHIKEPSGATISCNQTIILPAAC